jgi:hypothetical protein
MLRNKRCCYVHKPCKNTFVVEWLIEPGQTAPALPHTLFPMHKCKDDLHHFALYTANLHCYDPASLARELLYKEQ